jgi:hypothetical protein
MSSQGRIKKRGNFAVHIGDDAPPLVFLGRIGVDARGDCELCHDGRLVLGAAQPPATATIKRRRKIAEYSTTHYHQRTSLVKGRHLCATKLPAVATSWSRSLSRQDRAEPGRVKVRIIRTDEELMIENSVTRVLTIGSIREI